MEPTNYILYFLYNAYMPITKKSNHDKFSELPQYVNHEIIILTVNRGTLTCLPSKAANLVSSSSNLLASLLKSGTLHDAIIRAPLDVGIRAPLEGVIRASQDVIIRFSMILGGPTTLMASVTFSKKKYLLINIPLDFQARFFVLIRRWLED